MRTPAAALALALVLAADAASAGFELPAVSAALESARLQASRAPSAPGAPAVGPAEQAAAAVAAVKGLRAWELRCGEVPACLPDRIYYDKASVDARVDAALRVIPGLVRSGQLAQARDEALKVLGAAKYWGDKLAPARTPLYLAADVEAQVAAAAALLKP